MKAQKRHWFWMLLIIHCLPHVDLTFRNVCCPKCGDQLFTQRSRGQLSVVRRNNSCSTPWLLPDTENLVQKYVIRGFFILNVNHLPFFRIQDIDHEYKGKANKIPKEGTWKRLFWLSVEFYNVRYQNGHGYAFLRKGQGL